MEASDLARWTRFAAKGGIGKCIALQDCVAQGVEDLMFLKDDEVVVLLQLPQEDQYLGYCEGVVGRFRGSAVHFHGRLKKPVFAKRQSTPGTSPTRPISLSTQSPPSTSSSPASGHGPKLATRSATSPLGHSLPVPSPFEGQTAANHTQSMRQSVSISAPITQARAAQTHSRAPSNASSISHYSTHSRSLSQSHERVSMPAQLHPQTHARKASNASSRSAYSFGSRPPSRAPSRSDSVTGSVSEDTHTQHVSIPPPVPGVPAPALTDGSSAHSSVVLSPAPAFPFSFPHPPQSAGKAPASLFQGRHRSGSEKLLPRTNTPEGRRRSGSENVFLHLDRPRGGNWNGDRERVQGKDQVLIVQEHAPQELSVTGLSETSLKTASVYSDVSGEEAEDEREDEDERRSEADNVEDTNTRASTGVLNEDESDENGRRTASSSPDDLSDGGFGIGMTLLREDDDDESEDSELLRDSGNDDTAIGHADPTQPTLGKVQSLRKPITLPMRVVNRGSVSPSVSESEMGEDDTATQAHVQKRHGPAFRNSSSVDTVLDAIVPPRPPFAAGRASVGSRTSSLAPTDDEHWESDADIYDDYRYSRYSTHYSGSPAQHSSRRASKGSTKSGLSRASERPPLPDEESWKKNLLGADGTEESVTLQRKSPNSQSSSVKISIATDRNSASTASTTLDHSFTRGGEEATSTMKTQSETPAWTKSRSPSPVQDTAEVSTTTTPGAFGMMSLTSPLTRAFRESDDSKYSEASGEIGDEADEGQEQHTGTPVLPARRSLSSRSPDRVNNRSMSKSPALVSSTRGKYENERRTGSPNVDVDPGAAHATHLSVVTSSAGIDHDVIILNESPVSDKSPDSRPWSPADDTHLRVASPQSHQGSAPPSPLNPGFPPSPSSMASFTSTAPLTITKTSPISSPSTPRHPVSPPAIPFTGVPPPGRPPAHMQYAQHPYQYPQPQQQRQRSDPTSESLYTLRMAGQQRASTIHGRTQTDLLTATGPVPISFLLPGMLPTPPPASRPQPAPQQAPYGQIIPPGHGSVKSRIPDPQSASIPQGQDQLLSDGSLTSTPTQPTMRRAITVPAPPAGMTAMQGGVNSSSVPNHVPPVTTRTTSVQGVQPGSDKIIAASTPSSPLPRANFFPKISVARPRSRSFSGFHSDITEMVSQTLRKRSQDEDSRPSHASGGSLRAISPSPKISTHRQAAGSIQTPQGKAGLGSRPSHVPSPLSLPPTSRSETALRSPLPSPAPPTAPPTARAVPVPVKPPEPEVQVKRGALRKASSHLSLRPTQQTPSALASSSLGFLPQRRNSGQSAKTGHVLDEETQALRSPSPLKASSILPQAHEVDRAHDNGSPSSSSLARSGSLRSKMSISALKPKGTRSTRDGVPETPMTVTSTSTPADEDTVQIKDLEFELIRPVIPLLSLDNRGEESTDHKDVMSVRSADLRRDSSSVRSETLSPGGLSPSTDQRFFGSMNSSPDSFSRKSKGPEANTSVQAHRDRELRWISTMNSSDPAQAKKSKKIKRLLIEGVPSSVRYLVWAHISNSGSKKMSNVYTQLSKRRPAMAQDIEQDVAQSFPDHPHLREPKGPLVSVLFAYIAMVPDLRYHRGLAIIAGHLLLQSPEEDAFWTFLAMMDSYLRPYFMPASPQMGIDTNLFVKAVEVMDSQLATRIFTQLNVRPNELCGVWFSSVFAGALPLEHLHRVWDLFLYEGFPLLLRVGLAILSICRRYLLETPTSQGPSHMAYLLRPPSEALPGDPEQFIAQVLAVKLKDDDIRKSRVKMEAAVKQQRLPRGPTSQPSHPRGRARV